jgi:hypothetical protein
MARNSASPHRLALADPQGSAPTSPASALAKKLIFMLVVQGVEAGLAKLADVLAGDLGVYVAIILPPAPSARAQDAAGNIGVT